MSVQQHQFAEQYNHEKTHEVLHSRSYSSVNPLSLRWGDLEGNFVSLQNSIETRLKEVEIKETQLADRLRELEAREKQVSDLRNTVGLDSRLELGSMDGKKLLALLSESVSGHEKLCESVRRVLGASEEPGKLVLDALGELYSENAELSFCVGSAGKRSCVVLLEQLAEIGPLGMPAEVKAEAGRLAREWRAKIRVEGQKGVLEVLGFMLLLGAYDLVDEFDGGEMLGVLGNIRQRGRKIGGSGADGEIGVGVGVGGGSDWGVENGWGDNDSDLASTSIASPVSEEKTKQSLEDDLELVNQIASAFTSTFEALKSFCVGMDGKNLKLFLYQYAEENDSWSTEVHDALCHTPDPAKLVLEAIPGFIRSQPEFHKKLNMSKVRKSCILLMEQLIVISPPISPTVTEEALKIMGDWGSKLGQSYPAPVVVYGFLLFLAAYRLGSKYEVDELLRLLGISSQYKAFPELCRALGLAEEVFIQSLIQKTMLLEAVDNIYAYGLVDKFPPVRLLRGYLSYCKKRTSKKGDQSSSQHKQAINREIAATKAVMKHIAKYKLESQFPPQELEKQILDLEIKKGQINDTPESNKPKADRKNSAPVIPNRPKSGTAELKKPKPDWKKNDKAESKKPKADQKKDVAVLISPSVSCASTTGDSHVKVGPSLTEDLQLDDHVVTSDPSSNIELQLDDDHVENSEPSSKDDLQLDDDHLVKPEPSSKEELQLGSEAVKDEQSPKAQSHPGNKQSLSSSTSPWPRLESFCVNMYGKGLSFFASKPKGEPDSAVTSSTIPWPELLSFCVDMDGKGLRTFVYEHMDENESFGSEIRNALKHACDPGKLVLGAMPGWLRSQPEFDAGLNLKRVRKTRILLLEQLVAISPQISPIVKEEALKMANEWRSNLGFKFKASDNVYGFLRFIEAYGLVSNFEEEDLLGLLVPANQHRACPDLCRSLGFTDKASVVIQTLVQNSLTVEAIEHIYSFMLMLKFSPVLLLKDYLNSMKTIQKDGTKPPKKKDIEIEIVAVRSVIKCVAKYKLESEFSFEELERRVTKLETLKALVVKDPGKFTSSSQNVQT